MVLSGYETVWSDQQSKCSSCAESEEAGWKFLNMDDVDRKDLRKF